MREIKLKKLTAEAYSKYGDFKKFADPDGEMFGGEKSEFYRDLIPLKMGTDRTSWSICRAVLQDYIIKEVERSNGFEKAFLPLNGDIIVFVASATPSDYPLPLDDFEAFLVPKGTMVKLRRGVWHHGPLGYKEAVTDMLVITSERFVSTDIFATDLAEKDYINIKE